MLKFYNFFHLNLGFSSIEIEKQETVVKQCYLPLLEIAEELSIPIGIEASGQTIELLSKIDISIINRLKKLIHDGTIEFIGSGYSQLIGPLVPYEINKVNLEIGVKLYKEILDYSPNIFLVNEQAFSKSLVEIYNEINIDAIIMEWNNPFRNGKNWDNDLQFFPQYASGLHHEKINLIWNNSAYFQKFQRYAQGEIELETYLDFLKTFIKKETRFFPIYGSDAEVFDFRPGRYESEREIDKGRSEWKRISTLFKCISEDEQFEFLLPSQVIKQAYEPFGFNKLDLTSECDPITVKKQPKYNVLRWGLSGRNDFEINTRCHRLFQKISSDKKTFEIYSKELCYLWGSDFRTHITSKRWNDYLKSLEELEKKLDHVTIDSPINLTAKATKIQPVIEYRNDLLHYSSQNLKLGFNLKKGLAIDYFLDDRFGQTSLFGTLQQGFFDDIEWAADLFSGHLVYEPPASHKITDLSPVKPQITWEKDVCKISAEVIDAQTEFIKTIQIDPHEGSIKISNDISMGQDVNGPIRIGFVTLNPDAFCLSKLHFEAHNGGKNLEKFLLAEKPVDHGASISRLVSASTALGVTGGIFRLGDEDKKVEISFDNGKNAYLGFIQYRKICGKILCRMFLSIKETDDTVKPISKMKANFSYTIKIIAAKH